MVSHVAGTVPFHARLTGATPTPRHALAMAEPHRARIATPAQFGIVPSQLSYWLNNQFGDCVTASEAYHKAVASLFAGLPEVFIQDSVVKAWAQKNGVLNGADLLSVIQQQQKAGFSQGGNVYGDGAPTAVDYTSEDNLFNAIATGGCVKIGVAANQLQSHVGSKNGSFLTGFRKDTNEDHCVELSGFGTFAQLAQYVDVPVPSSLSQVTIGCLLFTWDTVNIIDFPSMVNITSEAWLRAGMTINGTLVVPAPVPSPTPVPVPPTPLPSGVTKADVMAAVAGGIGSWSNTALAPLQAAIQANMDTVFAAQAGPVVQGPVFDKLKALAAILGPTVLKYAPEVLAIITKGGPWESILMDVVQLLASKRS